MARIHERLERCVDHMHGVRYVDRDDDGTFWVNVSDMAALSSDDVFGPTRTQYVHQRTQFRGGYRVFKLVRQNTYATSHLEAALSELEDAVAKLKAIIYLAHHV